eukprot:m.7177 g.7177  ORF g.7177 m.7177 type:complete len:86 (-) comp2724_c0_seq1:117-374(-)
MSISGEDCLPSSAMAGSSRNQRLEGRQVVPTNQWPPHILTIPRPVVITLFSWSQMSPMFEKEQTIIFRNVCIVKRIILPFEGGGL